ncbi:CD166 antigen-like [Pristis pectinata]|uniref:CD166 antigen-like n=1 Tax=Pristis pectinata TaxID=685728 RepID=UPI00223C8EDD|nr:CD166 antigen-like [Pristis pectinata]
MGASCTGIFLQLLILILGIGMQVHAVTTVTAKVGDTVTLACEAKKGADVFLVIWRVEVNENFKEQLISLSPMENKIVDKEISGYKGRIMINKDLSLNIFDVGIQDEKIFSCSTVIGSDISESYVFVKVYKRPTNPEIIQPAPFLVAGKPQKVGLCVVKDSYPAANVSWQYNFENLDNNIPGVKMVNHPTINDKGFFDITSTLEYRPSRDEGKISFSCQVTYFEDLGRSTTKVSSSVDMFVHYNTSKISLKVSPAQDILEGTNVVLSCSGDGYPPPEKFTFTQNGEVKAVGVNRYELMNTTQEDTGQYACSQPDNPDIKDSVNITVHYLALTMSPNESVSKMVGENITLECIVISSGTADVILMKKNKVNQNPLVLKSLQYTHAGNYTCQAKLKEVKEIKREKSIIIRVEGKPRVIKLTKKVMNNLKVMSCVVEGFPKPAIQWNINGTSPSEEPIQDKRSQWCHKITIRPSENTTVTCTAINTHGEDQYSVNVTAMRFKEPVDEYLEQNHQDPKNKSNKHNSGNQAKVTVGIIIGLLIAAVIAGMIYWLYKKKSKTNERGTADEFKKINKGDNNHTSGSSAV